MGSVQRWEDLYPRWLWYLRHAAADISVWLAGRECQSVFPRRQCNIADLTNRLIPAWCVSSTDVQHSSLQLRTAGSEALVCRAVEFQCPAPTAVEDSCDRWLYR